MKPIMIFCLLTLSFNALAQDYYDLNWKLEKDEKIAYLTITEQIDSAEADWPSFYKSFLESLSDSIDSEKLDFKNFFKSFYEGVENYSMMAILQNHHDWIDVSLVREDLNDEGSNDSIKFQQFLKGIQLRGLLNRNGSIQSFYTRRDQKNLLAILFQLPSKPVKVGDIWGLDLNWITTDHNFQCDSMSRINEVELMDVKIQDNDTIAVLKYTNYEKIVGDFNFPFGNAVVPTMFDMRFDAICEFSVSKGRWRNYSGILSYKSTGYQNASYKKRYALIEEKDIPEKVLKYFE